MWALCGCQNSLFHHFSHVNPTYVQHMLILGTVPIFHPVVASDIEVGLFTLENQGSRALIENQGNIYNFRIMEF